MPPATTVAPTIEYRLRHWFMPSHYDVELKPDFYYPRDESNFTFNGTVTMHLECRVITREIHFHKNDMNIHNSSIMIVVVSSVIV